MRFKPVPEPPASLDAVATAQRAVPLVPGSADDCTRRLARRLDLPGRDAARTWLAFLRALELAERTPSGYRRVRIEPTPERLRDAFRRRVFGAEEALAALSAADEPRTADEAFEALRDRVPRWEHYRDPSGWEAAWRERTARLLTWLALLDLTEAVDGGYVASKDSSDGTDSFE
ncbi:hypothetical protein [Halegenticoccus tardaugens]|uniref:hypothetical protein n=1 Tax=Halegenticoccus tardaugens TaxID=2071624 RepID=UPI00100A40C5|nr:hypothetical protein [Halegenticoccus tardaugens]